MLSILDPFHSSDGPYNFKRDSSHLLLGALSRRGHAIFYAAPSSLLVSEGVLKVRATRVSVLESEPYFTFDQEEILPADRFSLILMRKDPPVDTAYLHTTQLLSLVSDRVWIINDPKALREWNEKLVILQFPSWIPPTLVTANKKEIDRFVEESGGMALAKSLDGFAGKGIQRLDRNSADTIYITRIDDLTLGGREGVMIQRYLPEVSDGEKRIFMIDGRPIGALLKIPPAGSFLSSPDLGGRIGPTQLTPREKKLCGEITPFLKKNGIFFAGVDLIGEKLIEINITSPGLLWEWNEVDNQRHEEEMIDLIEKKL